ncbi:flagellar protein export ATPase FliI [Lichenihabitans sp. Uapishka_5]|uniref:flagellar protein export ATPase FliI n=1 Tax=Lichenihabitans sp. Uapishka_5 TaxID=3037302 RepID=UPI0029E7FC71|nr:flagellar protein export ATPase FliI [Lichenihabitans sp. Uapishka_5]MDX7950344.1 flagellar protein export ATPase FliI [Lichenihabitans sp. Uapishka_5]
MNALQRLGHAVRDTMVAVPFVEIAGAVTDVAPTSYRIGGLSPFVTLGDTVTLDGGSGGEEVGEIVRIDRSSATVKPFGNQLGARLGAAVRKRGPFTFRPDPSWKGRVINALGQPIDDAGPLRPGTGPELGASGEPPNALHRARVKSRIKTGVRAIDIFCPICAGQRIGIFAGSGVGKSTLLAMLAGASGFDTVVIALVGERGREVREFIEESLGANRPKAITVVATGDESPMMRRLAPKTATAVAEAFRDRGDSVLLIVDSVTRYAHAARDVALAAGEPAVARGYAPSVFSDLPRLLERAGPGREGGGTITGVFSVLVDGDDHNDPVADTIRGTLDGHIVLDRKIAAQGRYPAIDLLGSLSRLAHQVWSPEQATLVSRLREMIARFEDTRDLRAMGGYQSGSDAELDQAVALVPRIYGALVQSPATGASEDAFRDLANALQKPK